MHLSEEGVEFGPGELAQHALFRSQPGADEWRPLQFVFGLGDSQDGCVVLLTSLLSFLLLELPVGLHFLGDFVNDGS